MPAHSPDSQTIRLVSSRFSESATLDGCWVPEAHVNSHERTTPHCTYDASPSLKVNFE